MNIGDDVIIIIPTKYTGTALSKEKSPGTTFSQEYRKHKGCGTQSFSHFCYLDSNPKSCKLFFLKDQKIIQLLYAFNKLD